MTSEITYLRCILGSAATGIVAGEVYPVWHPRLGETRIVTSEEGYVSCDRTDKDWIAQHFEPATAEDFEASVEVAAAKVRAVGAEQAQLLRDVSSFNPAALLSSGAAPDGPVDEQTSLAVSAHPAAQVRNRALGLNRRAASLTVAVKEAKGHLELKLGQKMAVALAALRDVQGVVAKLEEVVYTVQLYLGRDEEVVCLREGEPAPAETPICIRQNVLFMDEEIALTRPDGIDFEDIAEFDAWLLADPKHLSQVLPEPKGVVVLGVRRHGKAHQLSSARRSVERSWLIFLKPDLGMADKSDKGNDWRVLFYLFRASSFCHSSGELCVTH